MELGRGAGESIMRSFIADGFKVASLDKSPKRIIPCDQRLPQKTCLAGNHRN
jgi:hypothetical protein